MLGKMLKKTADGKICAANSVMESQWENTWKHLTITLKHFFNSRDRATIFALQIANTGYLYFTWSPSPPGIIPDSRARSKP